MIRIRTSYLFTVVLLAFVVLSPARAQSSGTIMGRVTHAETGRSLPGVNVIVKGAKDENPRGTSTGPRGKFAVGRLTAGRYTVQARFVGYAPRSRTVEVPAGDSVRVRFTLRPRTLGLDAVEVIAQRRAGDAGEEIEKAKIQEVSPRDAGELMRKIAGTGAVRRGPIGLDPVVRGLRETQVGVFVDGMRTFPAGPARMDSPLSHTDPSTMQSVEVTKGPYALTWGGGQLSAIRVETNDLFDVPRSTLVSGHVQTSYDTNVRASDVTGTANGRSGAFAYRLDGAVRQGNAYQAGDGTRVPAHFTNRELRTKVGYKLSNKEHLTAGGGIQRQEDVNYPGRLLNAKFFESGRGRIAYEYASGQGLVRSVDANVYGYQTLHTMNNKGKVTYASENFPGPPLRVAVTSDITTFGGRFVTELAPTQTLRLTVGADGYRAYRDAERPFRVVMNGEPTVPPFYESNQIWPGVSVADAGVFAKATRLFNRIEATTTIRADAVWAGADAEQVTDVYLNIAEPGDGSLPVDALTQQELNVSGALMVTASLSRAWSVSVGGGTAVRTANALERFADRFPANKAQTSAEFIGNPRLEPERSWQGDLEVEARYDRAVFSVSGFARRISNYITLSEAPDVEPMLPLPIFADGPFRYTNGTATFYGGETSASLAIFPSLTAKIRGSYLWAKNLETDQPALGVSPLQGTLGLRWEPSDGRFYLKSTLNAAAEQDRVARVLGETPTEGYLTLDVQGGLELGNGVSIESGVTNLTDTNYVNHLNSKNPYVGTPIPEPGRVFTANLRIRF